MSVRRQALFLSLPGADKPLPTDLRLFRAGENTSEKGTYLFDNAAARAVLDNLNGRGVRLPFDYNHGMTALFQLNPAEQAKAAGWFTLEVRNGELWAVNIEWTEEAADKIRKKEFAYFSPTFDHDEECRITMLVCVALTNTPALHGLDPLMAAISAGTLQPEGARGMDKRILAQLGLSENATVEQVLTALNENASLRSQVLSLTGKQTPAEALGIVHGWKENAEQNVKAQAELANLRKEKDERELSAALEEAKTKIPPAKVEEFRKLGQTLGVAALRAMLSVIPDHPATQVATPGAEGTGAEVALTPKELEVAKKNNIDPKAMLETKKKQIERGVLQA